MTRKISNKDIDLILLIIKAVILLCFILFVSAIIITVSPILSLIDKTKGTNYLKSFIRFLEKNFLTTVKIQKNPQKCYKVLKIENVKNGHDFEIFVANILKKLGYKTAITQASNDFGVDVIAHKDGIKYAIQCKLYSNNKIGNSAVQQVCAGKRYYKCDAAIVVTNNFYTKNAIELAKANNIILWDGNYLNKLIKKSNNL